MARESVMHVQMNRPGERLQLVAGRASFFLSVRDGVMDRSSNRQGLGLYLSEDVMRNAETLGPLMQGVFDEPYQEITRLWETTRLESGDRVRFGREVGIQVFTGMNVLDTRRTSEFQRAPVVEAMRRDITLADEHCEVEVMHGAIVPSFSVYDLGSASGTHAQMVSTGRGWE